MARPSPRIPHRRFRDSSANRPVSRRPRIRREQLHLAIIAVFDPGIRRAPVGYRRDRGLPAIRGDRNYRAGHGVRQSRRRLGHGVLFTRNPLPATPSRLRRVARSGQGEDVVSGRTTPRHLPISPPRCPACIAELIAAAARLEPTAAMCRMSSSRWRAAPCGCCRPGPPNALRGRGPAAVPLAARV